MRYFSAVQLEIGNDGSRILAKPDWRTAGRDASKRVVCCVGKITSRRILVLEVWCFFLLSLMGAGW